VSQLQEFDGHKLESVSKKGLELEEVDDEDGTQHVARAE
jgi:hypothetical protein